MRHHITFQHLDFCGSSPEPEPGEPCIVAAVLTATGRFWGEPGLGLYQGYYSDTNLLPEGTGLFGIPIESQLEIGSELNYTFTLNIAHPPVGERREATTELTNGETYTLYITAKAGNGWFGYNADLVDCEDNVLVADLGQFTEDIKDDAEQQKIAWTTFVYVPAVICW